MRGAPGPPGPPGDDFEGVTAAQGQPGTSAPLILLVSAPSQPTGGVEISFLESTGDSLGPYPLSFAGTSFAVDGVLLLTRAQAGKFVVTSSVNPANLAVSTNTSEPVIAVNGTLSITLPIVASDQPGTPEVGPNADEFTAMLIRGLADVTGGINCIAASAAQMFGGGTLACTSALSTGSFSTWNSGQVAGNLQVVNTFGGASSNLVARTLNVAADVEAATCIFNNASTTVTVPTALFSQNVTGEGDLRAGSLLLQTGGINPVFKDVLCDSTELAFTIAGPTQLSSVLLGSLVATQNNIGDLSCTQGLSVFGAASIAGVAAPAVLLGGNLETGTLNVPGIVSAVAVGVAGGLVLSGDVQVVLQSDWVCDGDAVLVGGAVMTASTLSGFAAITFSGDSVFQGGTSASDLIVTSNLATGALTSATLSSVSGVATTNIDGLATFGSVSCQTMSADGLMVTDVTVLTSLNFGAGGPYAWQVTGNLGMDGVLNAGSLSFDSLQVGSLTALGNVLVLGAASSEKFRINPDGAQNSFVVDTTEGQTENLAVIGGTGGIGLGSTPAASLMTVGNREFSWRTAVPEGLDVSVGGASVRALRCGPGKPVTLDGLAGFFPLIERTIPDFTPAINVRYEIWMENYGDVDDSGTFVGAGIVSLYVPFYDPDKLNNQRVTQIHFVDGNRVRRRGTLVTSVPFNPRQTFLKFSLLNSVVPEDGAVVSFGTAILPYEVLYSKVVDISLALGVGDTTTVTGNFRLRNAALLNAVDQGSNAVNVHRSIIPGADLVYNLGAAGRSFDTVFVVDIEPDISDSRLKRDIGGLPGCTAFLRAMRPVRYRFRSSHDTDKSRLGFLAQDLATLGTASSSHGNLCAAVVHPPVDDQGWWSLNPQALIPVLLQGTSELHASFQEDASACAAFCAQARMLSAAAEWKQKI